MRKVWISPLVGFTPKSYLRYFGVGISISRRPSESALTERILPRHTIGAEFKTGGFNVRVQNCPRSV